MRARARRRSPSSPSPAVSMVRSKIWPRARGRCGRWRAGDAQGFPGRRLPGARSAQRRRRWRAGHPAHVAARRTRSAHRHGAGAWTCSCCSKPSTSPTSSWRTALVDARRAARDLLLVGVNSRDLVTLKVVPGRLDALAACAAARRETRRRERRGHGGRCRARGAPRLRPRAGGQRAHVGAGSGGAGQRHAGRRARSQKHMTGSRRSQFIKICGMTTPAAVAAALACEVDAIGFVFAPSVRQVTPAAPVSWRRRPPQAGLRRGDASSDARPGRPKSCAISSPTSCRPTSTISRPWTCRKP